MPDSRGEHAGVPPNPVGHESLRAVYANRRFAAETVGALAVATVLLVVGVTAAESLIALFARCVGTTSLTMASPSDVAVAAWKLGFALSGPALVTWVAIAVHRARAHSAPSLRTLAAYFLVPLLAAAAGIALSALMLAELTMPTQDIPSVISVRDVVPLFWVNRVVFVTALLLWTAVFLRAGRPARKNKARRSTAP